MAPQNQKRLALTLSFATVFLFSLIACSSERAPSATPERIVVTVPPVVVTVQVTVLPSPLPSSPTSQATGTPLVRDLWVCVDLAIGYSAPNVESPVVFQIAPGEGQVRALEKSGDWYAVRSGDALAFMPASTLCSTQPTLSAATATRPGPAPTKTAIGVPTSTPTLPLQTMTSVPTSTLKPSVTSPPPSPTKAPVTTGCPQGCVDPPPGCAIKGNISVTNGDKIYHVPGGKYYTATTIDPKYGERWFCTEAEAIANGWRKSAQ
jgi:hypothetical protein